MVLEFGRPGLGGTCGPALLAVAFAAVFAVLNHPGNRWVRAAVHDGDGTPVGVRPVWSAVLAQTVAVVAMVLGVWWLASGPPGAAEVQEPFAPLGGVSAWLSLLLRTAMVVMIPWFLDRAWFNSLASRSRLAEKYFGAAPEPGGPANQPWRDRLRDCTVWFWTPRGVQLDGERIKGADLWQDYRRMMRHGTRLLRVLVWLAVGFGLFFFLLYAVSALVDRPVSPEIPARGDTIRVLIFQTQVVSAAGLLVLLVLVGDETVLTWRFVSFLRRGRTVYPKVAVERFASELGPMLSTKAAVPVAAHSHLRRPLGVVGPAAVAENSLLDDWIDTRLLADQTEDVGPLIMYPFVLVGLAIIARSPIFDNWDMGPSVLAVLGIYLLWSVAMAILLNQGAERARRKALRSMALDLIWLEGTPSQEDQKPGANGQPTPRDDELLKDLVPSFKELIERVKGLSRGAFAPFFEKPWVRAVLVPLGGAGGIQLLEFLLYARMQ